MFAIYLYLDKLYIILLFPLSVFIASVLGVKEMQLVFLHGNLATAAPKYW